MSKSYVMENRTLGCCLLWATIAGMVLASDSAGAGETNNANPARDLFVKACAPCHSKDGTAQTPAAKKLGVKDLSLSALTDSQIIQQILEGRRENQSTSKMPPFKDKLSQQEIESLVVVVKGFRK